MHARYFRFILIYILTLSSIYSPILNADQLSLPSADLIAPQVIHDAIKDPAPPGTDQKISAVVTDNVAVQSVTLFYRTTGSKEYKRKPMTNQGSNVYSAVVVADEISPPGIEYYIQATDTSGNNLLHGYSFSPLAITVSATAVVATERSTPAKEITDSSTAQAKEESSNKWLWIGLGVLAVGAAAGGGGGGGGGTPSATLTITTSEPTTP